MKPKHKEFVKKYIENGNNATASVKEVFGIEDDNYAAVKGNRLIRSDKIQNAIKSIADRIPDELLYETHIEGLKAKRIEQAQEVPDHAVRHKYLDTAYKLKNLYPKEGGTAIQINVNTDRQEFT